MRIAMMTNNYKPVIGGVPISIERLAQGLRKRGHTVYIFAPDCGHAQQEPFVIRCKTLDTRLTGEFPVLKPGANAISWTGAVTKVVIQPNWRYL